MKSRSCAYCGATGGDLQKEHVFPKCLYPGSKPRSTTQRLTVPACAICNTSWQDDEVHFRNIMTISGTPNSEVGEIWEKVKRSFGYTDGKRRLHDVFVQMTQVETPDGHRHMVYPGQDARVLRVVRKIIRGLCHHHDVLSPVADRRVWTDVLKYAVPQEFLDFMEVHHRDPSIVEYRFAYLRSAGVNSFWLLTFFENRTFIGVVSDSANGFDGD